MWIARGAASLVSALGPDRQTCADCPARLYGLCATAGEDDLALLRRFKVAERALPAGAHLYVEGEPCGELFCLLDGWVLLYRILPSGERQVLDVALSGAFLGFQPDPTAAMPHSAVCATPTRLCVFRREPVYELMGARPRLSRRLSWLLANSLRGAEDRLVNNLRRSAEQRLAALLLDLFRRVRRRPPERSGESIRLPLTQEQVGDAVGLTAVHVSRMLRRLREGGIAEWRNQRLTILNPAGLAAAAEGDGGPGRRLRAV